MHSVATLDSPTLYTDVPSFVREIQPDYPVYCVRPSILRALAREFVEHFPGKVLYAVKCNPHPSIIKSLYEGGIRDFETASLPEIKQVMDIPGRTCAYFMHPAKLRSAIRAAYEDYGVRHFVTDSQMELQKLIDEIGASPMVVLVRVRTAESPDALYSMSEKFGASIEEAVELLQQVERAGYASGVTFHVGSQCVNPECFGTALDLVGEVVQRANVKLSCLDVGGGFPVRYPNVDAQPVRQYIREIIEGIERANLSEISTIFAEPGRALVGPGCSLLTQVVLRNSDRLYLNDGVHGGLSELLESSYQLNTRVIRLDGSLSKRTQPYRIFGPTCDSIDRLPPAFQLPSDLRIGDWIEFDQVGAYSNALSTSFNGFTSNHFVAVSDEPISATGWQTPRQ